MVTRPVKRDQLKVKDRTDGVVAHVILVMKAQHLAPQISSVPSSSVIADAWGRDIFAYDYPFSFKKIKPCRLRNHFVTNFKVVLSKYCLSNGLVDDQGHPQYRVADEWLYHHFQHLDVVDIINVSTVDYLNDVRKIKKSSGD